ncbi:hypothetical protein ACFE04_001004 [Oxalis oulophora]
MPSLGAGRLKLRGEDLRVYGTDKEHALRIAEDPFYKQMAADFTKYQIAVDVFAFSDKYIDIASLGTLQNTMEVRYITTRVSNSELYRDLTRETAWEAVMRVRCGKGTEADFSVFTFMGIRFTTYHGNFMLRSTDLLALPAIDCDKAYAMQLSLEETLLTTQTVYFQVALLYTASCGERRIRIHTLAAPTVADLGEMYSQADTGAIVSLFSRLAIEKTLFSKLEDARNFVQLKIVKALKEYRNLYSVQHRLGSRMIYPESLKFLPLYGLALCKSTPLTLNLMNAAQLPSSQADELKHIVKRLPLLSESLDSREVYIFMMMVFGLFYGLVERLIPSYLRIFLDQSLQLSYQG